MIFLDLGSIRNNLKSWDLYAIIDDYQFRLSRLKIPGFLIEAHIRQIRA